MSVNNYFDEAECWQTQSAWHNVKEMAYDIVGLTAVFGREAGATAEDKELIRIENALEIQKAELISRYEDLSQSYSGGKLKERQGFNSSQTTPYKEKSDFEKARDMPALLHDIARGEKLYRQKAEEAQGAIQVNDDVLLSAEEKEKISQMLCDYGVTIDDTMVDQFPWDWLEVSYSMPAQDDIYLDKSWSQLVDQEPARTRDGLDNQSHKDQKGPDLAQ